MNYMYQKLKYLKEWFSTHVLTSDKRTILFWFFIVLLLHGYLVLAITGDEEVRITVPDEQSFIFNSIALGNYLHQFNFSNAVDFGPVLGYGYIFWLFNALFIVPFGALGGFSAQIFIGRLVYLFCFVLSLFFTYKTVSIYQEKYTALLGTFLIFLLPTFAFFGKIISVEYLLCFLLSCFMYLIASDEGNLSKKVSFASLILGIAIGVKLIALPFLLALLLYLFLHSSVVKIYVKSLLLVIAGFFISNPVLLISARARDVLLKSLPINAPFSLENLTRCYNFDSFTWDDIPLLGIKAGFGNELVLLLFIVFTILSFISNRKNKNRLFILSIYMITFLVFILSVCLKGSTFWTWYLFPAFLISVVPPLLLNFENKRLNDKLIAVFFISIFVLNIGSVSKVYKYKFNQINTMSLKAKDKKQIKDFFMNVEPGRTVVSSEQVLIGDLPSKGIPAFNHLIVHKTFEAHAELYNFSPHFFDLYPSTEYIIYQKKWGVLNNSAPPALPNDGFCPTGKSSPGSAKQYWNELINGKGVIASNNTIYKFKPILETSTSIIYQRVGIHL